MSNVRIARITDNIANAISLIAAAGLVLMTLLIAWQVFGRHVLNASPVWSEAGALIVMFYFVLLGAAVGVHEQYHLGLRLVVSRLPVGLSLPVYIAGQLVIGVFGLAMAWNGIQLIDFTQDHTIPSLNVSRSIAYWPFVICGGLIALFTVVRSLNAIVHRKETSPWS